MNADFSGAAGAIWTYTANDIGSFDVSRYTESLMDAYGVSSADLEPSGLCTPADPSGLLRDGPTIGRGPLIELQSTTPEEAQKAYERILSAPFAVAGAIAMGHVIAEYQVVKGVTVAGTLTAYEYAKLGWKMLFDDQELKR